MKRIASGVFAILLLLSMHGAARAEENAKAVAGLKTWINSWKKETPGAESMKSTTSTLVGWTAEAELSNRVLAGASYLVTAVDYLFDQPAGNLEAERNDLDVMIGYRFTYNVDVFTGYRSTRILEEVTKAKETLSGPLFGIRGSVPLNNTLSLFGELTYLPLINKATYAAIDKKEPAVEWFVGGGVRYVFTRKIVVALGYKYETVKGKHTQVTDTFSGATFDAMYSFD
jgi:hypothetical protein